MPKILEQLDKLNIADDLDEDQLNKIGSDVVHGYEVDLESRYDWEDRYDSWMDLAMQKVEEKQFPWPGAANVKYPTLTTAALQFGSRAYPALVSGTQVVKGRIVGFDQTGQKYAQAIRVGKHMSYQLLEEMEDWEEEMDKLCSTLPITVCMFKKTYFDSERGVNTSELVYPKDLVVNYWAKNLESAERKTHVLYLTDNDIYERVASGIYSDVDLNKSMPETDTSGDERTGIAPSTTDDDVMPYEVLEQHTFLDLDDDGYKEPYVVTVDYNSGQVLRIVARFDETGVKYTPDGNLLRIQPVEYFTKYSFVPNPDGGFYDVGFGLLLGPINDTINTVINQLLDAGTLSNMQGGFISRGIRINGGNKSFIPGEWKTANSTGEDLRKGIVPLPVREPSNVLFTLLGMMIDGANKLGSVTDMLTGENPGQNQPATTTMAVIEQGLKVFSSIYKRMHRSMKKEFKKLYRLNSIYLPPASYFQVLDVGEEGAAQIFQMDYDLNGVNIVPQADPNVASESQRLVKAQALLELVQLGTVNPQVVTQRILEAQDQPGIAQLMQIPQPQPNPEVLEKQERLQLERQVAFDESQRGWAELDVKAKAVDIKEFESISKASEIFESRKRESKEETMSNGGDKQS